MSRIDFPFWGAVAALLLLPIWGLAYFLGSWAAIAFVVSMLLMLVIIIFMMPVVSRRQLAQRRRWQQRCVALIAEPALLAAIDFEVVFDSARQYGAHYRGDELSPGEVIDSKQRRYGVVFEVRLDQHIGMQIRYWSAGREYQLMALGEAGRAEQGQLIRIDFVAHSAQGEAQELVIAIALATFPETEPPQAIL